jgi:site-specific DNA-methyltransferase (adenine-specific)
LIFKDLKSGRFYNEDCFDAMREIPDGVIDMILCDLPYGATSNKWDSVLPLDRLWAEYWRVCKPNSIIALTASQPFTSVLTLSNIKEFKHEWIWIKNRGSNFANTVREPMKEHETVLIFSKGKWVYNKQMQERTGGGIALAGATQKNKGGKSTNYGEFEGKDIELSKLRVPSTWQKFNCEVGFHPTQKPVALFEYLIKTYTNENELVLDNTAGSGTTAIAAINTNRKWVCIEKEKEYYDKAIERIENHAT